MSIWEGGRGQKRFLLFFTSLLYIYDRMLVGDGIHVTRSFGSCFWRLEKLHATCQMKMHLFMMQNVLYQAEIIQNIESIFISFLFFFCRAVCACASISYTRSLHSLFLFFVLFNEYVNIKNTQVLNIRNWPNEPRIRESVSFCVKVLFFFHSLLLLVILFFVVLL